MDALELKRVIERHRLWLNENGKGSRADLSRADLCGADLSRAATNDKYLQVSCIGSAKRMTTYNVTQDVVWCGCFKGTLGEFSETVEKTHKENAQYLRDYRAAIAFFKTCKDGE